MKKIIAIALTLMLLCGAASVFALPVPSKTTGDLVKFEIQVESPIDGKTPEMAPAADSAIADPELGKLQEVGDAAEYFSEEVTKGITGIIGGDGAFSVDDFLGISVSEYDEGMGLCTIIAQFSKAYGPGEKVAVLVGLIQNDGQVAWTVVEGVGVEGGMVMFTVPADVMLAIQNHNALLAVCSSL